VAPTYIVGSAVAFVFFLQVGLWVALRRLEAVADHPAVPWFDRRAMKPYLLPSWRGPRSWCWDPPGPEQREVGSIPYQLSFISASLMTTFPVVPLSHDSCQSGLETRITTNMACSFLLIGLVLEVGTSNFHLPLSVDFMSQEHGVP
jgi:hypothetical protein